MGIKRLALMLVISSLLGWIFGAWIARVEGSEGPDLDQMEPSDGLPPHNGLLAPDPPKIHPGEVGVRFKMDCQKQGKWWVRELKRLERRE